MTHTDTHMHTHRTWTKEVTLKLDHLSWIFQVPSLSFTQLHSAYTVSELTVNFRHIKSQDTQSLSKQSGQEPSGYTGTHRQMVRVSQWHVCGLSPVLFQLSASARLH